MPFEAISSVWRAFGDSQHFLTAFFVPTKFLIKNRFERILPDQNCDNKGGWWSGFMGFNGFPCFNVKQVGVSGFCGFSAIEFGT